ncbi:unnamed protein product [Cladocopium goreaui]|uniref:Uncharacterized protein n=1 Tax=Cladocopium goreaui TaxID=2562237 RepID=A0A9P1C1I7_9DINO|nr:unnamed protein product [Cladocopium goreaui]
MRTPRAVRAWQSADAALAAEIHRRPVGGGADVAMAEDPGWTPHRQFAPEELRYNPITHQVDVFVNVDGDIQKCEPSVGEPRAIGLRQSLGNRRKNIARQGLLWRVALENLETWATQPEKRLVRVQVSVQKAPARLGIWPFLEA